jgi:hypothetical protein
LRFELPPLEPLEDSPLDPEVSDLGPVTIVPVIPEGVLITGPKPITVQKDKVLVLSSAELPLVGFEELVSSVFSSVTAPSFSLFLLVYVTKRGNYEIEF